LTAVLAVYGLVTERGNKAVGHVEQMKASRCVRASRCRLGCISCHDPHQVPAPEEKAAYFRQQCLACHEQQGCSFPEPVRRAESRDDRCTQCHMPRSPSSDIAHVATTDHRILRMPRSPMTEPAPVVSGPPLVLLNGDDLGPEAVESLGRELAIAAMYEVRGRPVTPSLRRMGSWALGLLDQALAQRPEDPVVRRARAEALVLLGRKQDALQVDQSVLRSAPSYEQALDDGIVYAIELGDSQAARTLARRVVALNPGSARLHERLAYASLQRQDWDAALHESREALRLNPFLRFARMFLVQSLLHQHDLTQAQEEFTTLTKLNPTQRESLERWFADQRQKPGT
jgi:hypothetical protein